jgi:hypothetical protein
MLENEYTDEMMDTFIAILTRELVPTWSDLKIDSRSDLNWVKVDFLDGGDRTCLKLKENFNVHMPIYLLPTVFRVETSDKVIICDNVFRILAAIESFPCNLEFDNGVLKLFI